MKNMYVKCAYCGSMINSTDAKCRNCGAANDAIVRTVKEQPHTIVEFQEWYKSKGLPPYTVTRFFIGEDYRGARAFGIYYNENNGNYVVYKNTSSGQRCVHYEGCDEEYAVNELLQRLQAEIIQQKMFEVKKRRGTD